MKHALKIGTSAIAFILATPGLALAIIDPAPTNTCGAPVTTSDPNKVNCASPNYTADISYNQSDYPTAAAGLAIEIYGGTTVTTNDSGASVRAIGSTNNLAIVTVDGVANGGANITNAYAGAYALNAIASGTGAATVNNFGTVSTAGWGLVATAGTGLATVLNGTGGSVTLTPNQNATSYGLYASGGSASVTNNGTITVNAAANGSSIVALAGYASGGAVSVANTGIISIADSSATSLYGLDAVGTNLGAVTVSNSGSLTLTTNNSATGLVITDNASGPASVPSAVSITNSGVINVNGAQSATGVAVNGGGAVTISNTRKGATGGLSLTGNALTGYSVSGTTGALSITNSGMALNFASTGSGAVSAVTATSGSTQSVNFFDQTILSGGSGGGSTTYSGDVTLNTAGQATGVSLTGATGAIAVGFTGAALSVTGTSGATGITTTNGTSVNVTTATDAATGKTAALTVNGAGGRVTGVSVTGASLAETVVLGSGLTVTNTSGRTNGIVLAGGTSQSITLSAASSFTGTGGTSGTGGTVGASQTGGSGAVAFSQTGTYKVSDSTTGTGTTTGLIQTGGTSQTATFNGVTTVLSTDTAVTGVSQANATGAQAVTLNNALTVTNTGSNNGTATGVMLAGAGGAQTVTLTGAVNVMGANSGNATGVSFDHGGGLATLQASVSPASPLITVSTGTGTAIGVSATNGAGLLITAPLAISATSGQNADGILSSGQTGDQTVTVGAITATSTAAQAFGVSLTGSSTISLTDAVTIAANGVLSGGAGVILNATGNSSTINAKLNTVTTTGSGTSGMQLTAANSTIGSPTDSLNAAAVTVGTVTTTGANADGIDVTTGAGRQLINSTILVSVSGAGSNGILANSTSGAVTVNTATVATSSVSGGYGIGVQTNSGAIIVNAGTTNSGTGDAIHLTSNNGAVTLNLADGGATASVKNAGVYINTGGTATVNLGSAATTASLSGQSIGLDVIATGGQTDTLSGTVGAGDNRAVSLSGGAATLTNLGVINGYVTTSTDSLSFNNKATWNTFGGNSTFTSNSVLNNSGIIHVVPAATTATSLSFSNLSALNNSGTLSIDNNHTGDVLNSQGTAFTGSGASKLVLDINLSAGAVGASAAQTANSLVIGAAGGVTSIVLKDLGAGLPTQFNMSGIRVVTANSTTAGAFVLAGGPIDKGFVRFELVRDSANNWDVVGVPTAASFELVRAGAEAEKYWRLSSDVWADQMRHAVTKPGLASWLQIYSGGETDKSNPTYAETVAGNAVTFTPDLSVRNSWYGFQLGFEKGIGNAAIGLTAGYAEQTGRFDATGDQVKLTGGNVGLYARYQDNSGLYLNALAKVDRYTVNYEFVGPANVPQFDGTSYGATANAGYNLTSGAMFFAPEVGASYSHANLDGLPGSNGTISASYSHTDSLYVHAGAQVGFVTHAADLTIKPYFGVRWEDETNGVARVALGLATSGVDLSDVAEGSHARIEAGVQGITTSGVSLFAKVAAVEGSKAQGFSGALGAAIRW